MPDSQEQLERRRAEIVHQIAQLGDLRPGSVTPTSGRCGKLNCRCHRPGQPGHGPNPRLTYKVDGKTVSESLPTRAAQTKAERELAEFRKFQQLCRDFVEVNIQLCRMRSVEAAALTPQEKKRPRRSAKRSRGK